MAKFNQISPNEVKFKHKDTNFLLEDDSIGTYGIGSAIRLFRLDGGDRKFIKCVGWTKSDNHNGPKSATVLIPGITTMVKCQTAALRYVTSLMV